MARTPKTTAPVNHHPAAAFLARVLPNVREWFGLVGYIRLDGQRHVRVEVVDRGTRGTFTAVCLSLVHADNGRLDVIDVRFDDVLDKSRRSDARPDFNARGTCLFSIVDHCGWDWYIAKPADESPIAATVDRYVALWSRS